MTPEIESMIRVNQAGEYGATRIIDSISGVILLSSASPR